MYCLTSKLISASAKKARLNHLNALSLCSNTNLRQNFRPSEDLAKERYESRANEDTDKKRARLLYQSRKRGMLENGVILASFADKFLSNLDSEQLDQYDRLINLPTNDWDIFYWATRTKPTPKEYETSVMQMLREHLKNKVSKGSDQASGEVEHIEGKQGELKSFLEKMHPDDIAMPAAAPKFKTLKEVDIKKVNLVDYKSDLIDSRVRKISGSKYVEQMTEWRKKFFLKRLRRTLPAPISVRHLRDNGQASVYSQKSTVKDVAIKDPPQANLIDTTFERNMKQHHFLQRLMSSNFTDDVHEYDAEAEAWANMIWLRDYGTFDYSIALTSIRCNSCQAKLQCCDTGLEGYLPKELLSALTNTRVGHQRVDPKCQRCKFAETYGASLNADVEKDEFVKMMKHLKTLPASIAIYLVDLTDFPAGIYPDIGSLIGLKHRLIVVGNKLDLLPYDGLHMIDRVTSSVRANLWRLRPNEANLNLTDVMVLSARTGFGVDSLVSRILALCPNPRDVYIIGCSNSGKSTLFNALLQSDLSQAKDFDLLSRVSKYNYPNTDLSLLRFPVYNAEGWEIETMKQRQIRIERNFVRQEQKLESTTARRQSSMPHMSMLINRLSFPPTDALEAIGKENQQIGHEAGIKPRFTEDHPLAQVDHPPFLSADEENYKHNSFCYHTPSTSHWDQLHTLFTVEEQLWIYPKETIIPRKYSLRPLQSILIAGLARLDLLTATSNVIITVFASKLLPIHIIATRKADFFYNTFLGTPYLGVPFGDEKRLARWPKLEHRGKHADMIIEGTKFKTGAVDIVLGSIGWALVNVSEDQECIVRAFTPQARGIFRREPPLLVNARVMKGKKIRDTPLFENQHYTNESASVFQ